MPPHMPKTSKQALVDRRAVVLSSVVIAAQPLAVPAVAASGVEASSGRDLQFTETEHVRQFYAKCRF